MNTDRLFSDNNRLLRVTVAFALVLSLCLFSSVMGRSNTQSKADRFLFCIDHPQSCKADVFDIWVRTVGCSNNKTTATLLNEKFFPGKKQITLSTQCKAHQTHDRVRLIGKVSDHHVLEVLKSSSETTVDRLVQWSKYLISIFGLFLASIFIYRQAHHNRSI